MAGLYVQDTLALGKVRGGHIARPLTELGQAQVQSVLVAAFDAGRIAARLAAFLPKGAEVLTLDDAKLPEALVTNTARYLEPVNFATNFVFFRDDDHFATRLTTANYWAGYGARNVRFFHRLYDGAGAVLAEWEDKGRPASAATCSIARGAQALRPGAVHRAVVHPCRGHRRA